MAGWFHGMVLLLRLACADKERVSHARLPRSSAEFSERFSCDGLRDDSDMDEEGDPFFRWVLSARHTTWQPGWEVAVPRSRPDATGEGETHRYARVFDLLNWARQRDLAPAPVEVSSICHKGMEGQLAGGRAGGVAVDVPPTPNGFVPGEMWSDLWSDCHKQLLSMKRLSSSCIDIPGLLVKNPGPPMKVNNPCHLEHRMVDGAHRICLRKYLMVLLAGELAELEELAKRKDHRASADDILHARIWQKRRLVDRTAHGLFFVINQTTFQSMLMSADPHASWAKDRETLTQDVTEKLRREWKKWMSGAMDRVGGGKKEIQEEECGDIS